MTEGSARAAQALRAWTPVRPFRPGRPAQALRAWVAAAMPCRHGRPFRHFWPDGQK
eukprot:NODE_10991_length_422_cov_9.729223_g9870_i0.p2 GENE.NODE_10991_length_422_cov_9.729223_g9870_i0~~NODE_10991_length_422_cov_9.729223_g9870_i0.p2  ORF type:complete len:56 (+),score=4.14 NODE_10991_length_422_cov_9.729223_g9870_i0:156-323(+)